MLRLVISGQRAVDARLFRAVERFRVELVLRALVLVPDDEELLEVRLVEPEPAVCRTADIRSSGRSDARVFASLTTSFA